MYDFSFRKKMNGSSIYTLLNTFRTKLKQWTQGFMQPSWQDSHWKPWVFSNACVMPVPLGTTEWSLSLLAHCQSPHRALVRLPWLTSYTGHKLNHWSFFESSQEIHRSNHLLLIICIVWFISYNLKARKYPVA